MQDRKEFAHRLIKFSLNLIKFCSKIRKISDLLVVADQLLRSGTSIGANIIEAKASSSKKEFIKYYLIALKSSNETQYWLILIKEANSGLANEAEELLRECIEISNIIGSSVVTMRKNNE